MLKYSFVLCHTVGLPSDGKPLTEAEGSLVTSLYKPRRRAWKIEKMADLARKYHEDLQYNDLNLDLEDRELKINLILDEIPEKQTLNAADAAALDRPLTEAQLGKALQMAKNGSATGFVTGMDGCPYELWKTLRTQQCSTNTPPKKTARAST
jgi:hypothetical protein